MVCFGIKRGARLCTKHSVWSVLRGGVFLQRLLAPSNIYKEGVGCFMFVYTFKLSVVAFLSFRAANRRTVSCYSTRPWLRSSRTHFPTAWLMP